jgi:hypothetical protein
MLNRTVSGRIHFDQGAVKVRSHMYRGRTGEMLSRLLIHNVVENVTAASTRTHRRQQDGDGI